MPDEGEPILAAAHAGGDCDGVGEGDQLVLQVLVCGLDLGADLGGMLGEQREEVLVLVSGVCFEHAGQLRPQGDELVRRSAVSAGGHSEMHDHGTPDGLQWEDLMPDVNCASARAR